MSFTPSAAVGTIVADRYEVQEHLTSGGFGQIYQAFDRRMERQVALKFLMYRTLLPGSDQAEIVIERFEREAKLAARIQHPNVVNVFDYGVLDGEIPVPYIVMELLTGHDLKEHLKAHGPLTPKRAFPLFLDCLEALGEAHRLGIVHKDLKPSNLFLSNPGRRAEALRILDFGVAHIKTPATDERLTKTGEVFGTPAYLAPEYLNELIVTPSLDVYQMALILAEAIMGERIVNEKAAIKCMTIHTKGELAVPVALLDSPLGPVLRKALAFDHRDRYQDADELAAALRQIDIADIPQVEPGALRRYLHPELVEPSFSDQLAETIDETSDLPQSTGSIPASSHRSDELPSMPTVVSDDDDTFVEPEKTPAELHSPAAPALAEAHTNVLGAPAPEEHSGTFGDVVLAPRRKWVLWAGVALMLVGALLIGAVALLDDEPQEPVYLSQTPEALASEEVGDELEGLRIGVDAAQAAQKLVIVVETEPSGATIYRGEKELGPAPVSIEFANDSAEPVTLSARLSGYETQTFELKPTDARPHIVTLEAAVENASPTAERSERKRRTRKPRATREKSRPTSKAPDKKERESDDPKSFMVAP